MAGLVLAIHAILRPPDKVFDFEEIVEAHRYLLSNEQFGKIVVTL
jgi:hypothetical protein